MTEPTILDEGAVSEIEALRHRNTGPSFGYTHELCVAIDALCATVKHLREQKAQAQEDAAYSAKLANEKADEVTREVRRAFAFKQERDRLATGLANLYHVITGHTCEQAVALGMATSAVSSLQSQLEQLRAENERLKAPRIKKTDLAEEGLALVPRLFANPKDLESIARVPELLKALCDENNEQYNRIVELERRLRIPFGKFPCALCGGPHDFDTSVPSVIWNAVIRARDLPDYLCTTCIVREFVRAGQGFTAELWNEEFNGVPIEMVINGQNAKDAALIQEENNSLRNQLHDAAQSIVNEADKVGQLMRSAATAMRDKCVATLRQIAADYDNVAQPNNGAAISKQAVLYAARQVESLTLDQVKPGEM